MHSFASLIRVMWCEWLHSENRICHSHQSIFTFDFWFVFMNAVSWHRNAPPVNSNCIHVRFHVLVIWIQSSRVSVSRNNIHEYKSEVKCENWLIWTTNSVLWMQLFISHHTNERSEWVQLNKYQIQFFVHMSIKSSSLFICQSILVLCSYVNQIWFFVLFLLITRTCIRRRARPRDYFFLNVLFANANKNKYSQQNHKWTCGCCLLILNYFLPLVSKYSRSLRTLILNWFILFRAGAPGRPREYHIKTKQKRLEIKMSNFYKQNSIKNANVQSDFRFVLTNAVSWHRNTARLNSNQTYTSTCVQVVCVRSRYLSVSSTKWHD